MLYSPHTLVCLYIQERDNETNPEDDCVVKSKKDAAGLSSHSTPSTSHSQDCFHEPLNFVFGLAHFKKGCIVSTYRLSDDPDFCLKVNATETCVTCVLGNAV